MTTSTPTYLTGHRMIHGVRLHDGRAEWYRNYVVTPELDTVGPCDFAVRLTGAMTAHPTCDPVTGELHVVGYSPIAPHLTCHRLPLLTLTTRLDGSASQLLVVVPDASDVAAPPVAAVTLPRGAPAGFHGRWIED